MSEINLDAAARVDAVLRRAGLTVTDEERARLIAIYPTLEGFSRQLRLAETRYAEPAVIYPAAVASTP